MSMTPDVPQAGEPLSEAWRDVVNILSDSNVDSPGSITFTLRAAVRSENAPLAERVGKLESWMLQLGTERDALDRDTLAMAALSALAGRPGSAREMAEAAYAVANEMLRLRAAPEVVALAAPAGEGGPSDEHLGWLLRSLRHNAASPVPAWFSDDVREGMELVRGLLAESADCLESLLAAHRAALSRATAAEAALDATHRTLDDAAVPSGPLQHRLAALEERAERAERERDEARAEVVDKHGLAEWWKAEAVKLVDDLAAARAEIAGERYSALVIGASRVSDRTRLHVLIDPMPEETWARIRCEAPGIGQKGDRVVVIFPDLTRRTEGDTATTTNAEGGDPADPKGAVRAEKDAACTSRDSVAPGVAAEPDAVAPGVAPAPSAEAGGAIPFDYIAKPLPDAPVARGWGADALAFARGEGGAPEPPVWPADGGRRYDLDGRRCDRCFYLAAPPADVRGCTCPTGPAFLPTSEPPETVERPEPSFAELEADHLRATFRRLIDVLWPGDREEAEPGTPLPKADRVVDEVAKRLASPAPEAGEREPYGYALEQADGRPLNALYPTRDKAEGHIEVAFSFGGQRVHVVEVFREPRPPVQQAGWSAGVSLIAAERRRQVEREGWSAEHDDEHTNGQLAFTAAELAKDGLRLVALDDLGSDYERDHCGSLAKYGVRGTKPDRIRALSIAGALLAAEIDRLKRAARLSPGAEGGGAHE